MTGMRKHSFDEQAVRIGWNLTDLFCVRIHAREGIVQQLPTKTICEDSVILT